jgi:valyl-tRNA synthetase
LEAADHELSRLLAAVDGVDRFEARKRIVVLMALEGRLQKIEPHQHAVPHGDRSQAVVEPWLTDQWYVDAKTLAQPALAAVREDKTRFVPKNWEKTYFEWLENIQPWCISRQLWWGHQIPAWYAPWGEVYVEEAEETAYARALADGVRRGALSAAEAESLSMDPARLAATFSRDPDVLDTWFSSALWPFSTLGWPEATKELKRFYPTSVLVTGFDIIFFWVARMMMMGLHFQDEAPFRDVYIHALVRDEKGAKMSKSKGNVMDPLDIIDGVTIEALVAKRTETITSKAEAAKIAADTRREFPKGIPALGTDALRFFLAAMAAQGRDVKLSLPRIEGYRNFATKVWNASRFAELNGCVRVVGFDPDAVREPLNRWILGEASKAVAETSEAIEAFRFNDAANAVYRFVWNLFCDWHLELAKPVLQGGAEGPAKAETQATIAHTLDIVYALLHPFMPFVTEELWAIKGEHGPSRAGALALGPWPRSDFPIDRAAEAEIGWIVELVSEIRSVRSEVGVPAGAQLPLTLVQANSSIRRIAEAWGDTIKRLARIAAIEFADGVPAGSLPIVVRDALAALPLVGVVDIEAEKARLDKEIARERLEIAKVDAKLANPDFVARAPETIIAEHQERREASLSRIAKMEAARRRLDQI